MADYKRNEEEISMAKALAQALDGKPFDVPAVDPPVVVRGVSSEDEARAIQDLERSKRLLEWHGWPERAVKTALVAQKRAAIRAVTTWKPQDGCLVLSGRAGSGKTVAAAWIAICCDLRCLYLRAAQMAQTSRFNEEVWSAWRSAKAMCLDDLGAEYADNKGSFVADLDQLVDIFYGNKRPLIITTNCSAKEFEARYGERITGRMRECATWIGVDGQDLRRATAK